MGTTVWVLMKMVLYSASAADAMILRMILYTTSKMPLVVGQKFCIFRFRWGFGEKIHSTGSASGLRN